MTSFLNLGAFGVFLLPSGDPALGYGTAGISLLVPAPFHERISFIPAAGIEIAPRAGNWGLYGSVTTDYLLTDRLGLDLTVTVIHDWDPLLMESRGRGHTGYLAVGPGLSVLLKTGVAVSPYLAVSANLEGLGWGLNPGLNLAVPLP